MPAGRCFLGTTVDSSRDVVIPAGSHVLLAYVLRPYCSFAACALGHHTLSHGHLSKAHAATWPLGAASLHYSTDSFVVTSISAGLCCLVVSRGVPVKHEVEQQADKQHETMCCSAYQEGIAGMSLP